MMLLDFLRSTGLPQRQMAVKQRTADSVHSMDEMERNSATFFAVPLRFVPRGCEITALEGVGKRRKSGLPVLAGEGAQAGADFAVPDSYECAQLAMKRAFKSDDRGDSGISDGNLCPVHRICPRA